MNIDLDFKIIGLRIQKRRSEKKMTQAELAERIDTNQRDNPGFCVKSLRSLQDDI